MEMYLTALNQSKPWAVKMYDATGRYSSGFFWGNGYWMGSQVLCYNVENSTPFPLGFNVIKLLVQLPRHLHNDTQRVNVGICLPYNCTSEDVHILAESSLPQGVELLKVRSPHNRYNFWDDAVFWTLVGVSVFVFLMLVFGTAYDLYLDHTSSCDELTSYSVQDKVNGVHIEITLNNNALKENGHGPGQVVSGDQHSVIKVFCQKAPGILSRILLSFSVKMNLETICDSNVGADTIPTIHGLRSLSMVWVILGHTCIVAFKYSDNTAYRAVVEEEFLFQTISNGTFSVDTFFFISGLLVSFLYFRTIAKIDVTKLTRSTGVISNILQFLGLLGYRYCRLTVPYMYVLGVVQVCMKWFQHNSVFEPPTNDHENCPNYWWRNALYINTLFPVKDMCMLWSWYLADDTQFYVVGAVLLILATSHFRLSAVFLTTFLATSWCTTAYIAFTNKHMPGTDDPLALFDKIYDKPWTRLGPYLIGMCVGWLLYRTDCKIKMNKAAVVAGWILSTTCFLCLIYGLYKVELHPLLGAAYSSLSHTAWALGLAWIVVACSTGYGGYVNKLLSMSILYPFSRVTYCAYLVHPLIIRVVPMSMDSPFHLTKETVLLLFLGQLVASYILAFVVSLAFEAPVVSLLKILAPPKNEKPKNDDTDDRNCASFS
ncbi:nose resistant to fluoxetine protein 6 [Anabrus simplex]|uniref:nose resistant to fluoxetine protein 6 n=1 Tax=Anabrus simplex TaxID=316456 RepID=UPI0035A2D7BD